MRHFPTADKYDQDDLKRLNAHQWMVDLLKLNPSYCSWGPHEDYMLVRNAEEGPDDLGRPGSNSWNSRLLYKSWKDFGIKLDEYNEVVNFYFELSRDNKQCTGCNGTCFHPDAQWVSESFYKHSSPFCNLEERERQTKLLLASFTGSIDKSIPTIGKSDGNFPSEATLKKYKPEFREFCEKMASGKYFWSDDITEDEKQALRDNHRSWDYPLGHDAINRSILIKARLKRYGMPRLCVVCDGEAYEYIEPEAHVNLILWILHPRKGCSRGAEIQRIQQNELPKVFKFLRTAADRNAARFAEIP